MGLGHVRGNHPIAGILPPEGTAPPTLLRRPASPLTRTGAVAFEVNRTDRSLRRRVGKTDPVDAEAAARAVLAGTATAIPKTCQFPGCDLLGRLHAHHIVHREHHGPNVLDNLITLCAFHHRLVHEGGYRIELLMGRVLVHRPGREPLAHTPPCPVEGVELELRNLAEGLDIDDTTAMSLWDGTRVRADDLSSAILSVRQRQN